MNAKRENANEATEASGPRLLVVATALGLIGGFVWGAVLPVLLRWRKG